jgi:hypothetical protein
LQFAQSVSAKHHAGALLDASVFLVRPTTDSSERAGSAPAPPDRALLLETVSILHAFLSQPLESLPIGILTTPGDLCTVSSARADSRCGCLAKLWRPGVPPAARLARDIEGDWRFRDERITRKTRNRDNFSGNQAEARPFRTQRRVAEKSTLGSHYA